MKNWKTITAIIFVLGGIGALIGSNMLDAEGTRLIVDYGDSVNGREVKQAARFVKYLSFALLGAATIVGFLSFKGKEGGK